MSEIVTAVALVAGLFTTFAAMLAMLAFAGATVTA